MKHLRLGLLLLLFLSLLFAAWRSGILLERWPRPLHCSAAAPEWVDELVEFSGELGWPGFQLAYIDSQGQQLDCAAGWAGFLRPMRDDHVMRYVSLSKIFTSLVMAQLFAEERLYPDDLLVVRLGIAGPFADPRIAQITLDQLLRHTAGFDRSAGFDPMLVAQPWCPDRLQSLSGVQLDYAPGSQYAYSNLGYCLLGAVIAEVEKDTLDSVYRRRLLSGSSPLSIAAIGRGEVRTQEPARYFDSAETVDDLLLLDYESLLAVGAWTGTARDLLMVLNERFEREGRWLLDDFQCSPATWRACHGSALYAYRQTGGPLMYWRDGSLPGVSAFFGAFEDGSRIVVLANGRRQRWMDGSDRLGQVIYQWLR